MKKSFLNVSIVCLITILFSGCSLKTHIDNVQTNIGEGQINLSLAQIERSIYKAATHLGWRLQKIEDGYSVGDYNFSKYSVSVDIRYTNSNYFITYNSSTNLKYDGKKILSLYNTWIEELDKEIKDVIAQTANELK